MSNRSFRRLRTAPLLALAGSLIGCPDSDREPPRTVVMLAEEQHDPQGEEPAAQQGKEATPRAQARLLDREGKAVGRATLVAVPEGVELRLSGRNLPPGPRAFHVHERGVCDPADAFKSAGKHFSPHDREHGLANPEGPHAGDMPDLEVQADGTVDFRYVLPGVSLRPAGEDSLIAGDGTALVIHAGPDDDVTDPDGAAGDRIACGVIERAG
jgi:superoxide dismutase, Cu-Zn family